MSDENVVRLDRVTPRPVPAAHAPRAKHSAHQVQIRVDLDEADPLLLERQLRMLHDATGRALAMAKELTRRSADVNTVRTHIRGVLMATNRMLNVHRRDAKIS